MIPESNDVWCSLALATRDCEQDASCFSFIRPVNQYHRAWLEGFDDLNQVTAYSRYRETGR